jgi:hypothetical protein
MSPVGQDALERAASDDDRPIAALVRKIVEEWLREKGYLPKPC